MSDGATRWTPVGDTDPIGFPPLGATGAAEQKLNRIAVLLNAWNAEVYKLQQMSENFAGDVTVTRMITMADQARQLEEVLYDS